LHKEELHDVLLLGTYYTSHQTKQLKWVGYVTCSGEEENACSFLVAKLEGKRPLGRLRCWWEDDIKMDLKEQR
jgi:hypothetical protein